MWIGMKAPYKDEKKLVFWMIFLVEKTPALQANRKYIFWFFPYLTLEELVSACLW